MAIKQYAVEQPIGQKEIKGKIKNYQNKSGNRISQNLQDVAKTFWMFIAVNVYIKKI